jgi:hypothetical protein
LEGAFDFYDVMNAQEKLSAVKARAAALKKKSEEASSELQKIIS